MEAGRTGRKGGICGHSQCWMEIPLCNCPRTHSSGLPWPQVGPGLSQPWPLSCCSAKTGRDKELAKFQISREPGEQESRSEVGGKRISSVQRSILLWLTLDKAFRTSLVVQWLRLHTPNAGVPGSNPAQRNRSHMPQMKNPACHSQDGRPQVPYLRPGAAKRQGCSPRPPPWPP